MQNWLDLASNRLNNVTDGNVFRFGFAVSSQLTSGRRPHVISVRHLMGLGEKMSGGQNPAYSYIFADCLSSVCCLPKVVLASYYLLLDLHFGIMPFNKETETKYRGLSPHKITPMSGVLHAKPDLRVV